MIKNSTDGKSNRVSLGLKCSECLHFEKGPRKFERTCVQLGIEPFADACPEFTPDLTVVASISVDALKMLASVANGITAKQARLLAYTFRNIDYVKKTSFAFGETLVFSLDGKDYLESYFRGVLVGANKQGKVLYLASSLEKMNGEGNAFISVMASSVFTLEEFRQKRAKLVKSSRISAPVRNGAKKSIISMLKMTKDQLAALRKTLDTKPDTYEPPTIDNVPREHLEASAQGSVKKRKKPEVFDVSAPQETEFKIKRYI